MHLQSITPDKRQKVVMHKCNTWLI